MGKDSGVKLFLLFLFISLIATFVAVMVSSNSEPAPIPKELSDCVRVIEKIDGTSVITYRCPDKAVSQNTWHVTSGKSTYTKNATLTVLNGG